MIQRERQSRITEKNLIFHQIFIPFRLSQIKEPRGKNMGQTDAPKTDDIVYRTPEICDGKYFFEIAKASKTLDVNSPYHYLILCRHFRKTCIVAEELGKIIGFVTAYIPPDKPDTVFVWQVAVAETARGKGIGVHMLLKLFYNLKSFNVNCIDATITPANQASINLFSAVARALNAPFVFEKEFFKPTDFGKNIHDPEMLFHIGPISG